MPVRSGFPQNWLRQAVGISALPEKVVACRGGGDELVCPGCAAAGNRHQSCQSEERPAPDCHRSRQADWLASGTYSCRHALRRYFFHPGSIPCHGLHPLLKRDSICSRPRIGGTCGGLQSARLIDVRACQPLDRFQRRGKLGIAAARVQHDRGRLDRRFRRRPASIHRGCGGLDRAEAWRCASHVSP